MTQRPGQVVMATTRHSISRACLAALLMLVVASCGDVAEQAPVDVAQIIETRDLDAILEAGEIRILLPQRSFASHLPRSGYPLDFERELAESFAMQLGVEPVLITVDSRDRMIPELLAGRGDLVAANLTVTPSRREEVDFSVPVAVVREQLVSRADDDSVSAVADLEGRRIALRRSSSFWNTVERLRELRPGIEIEEVGEDVDTEEIIHRVAIGEYDLTVADSNLLEACLEYRDDVRPALDLTRDRPIAMAVPPGSPDLLENLDRFLTEAQLTDRAEDNHTGDLTEIKQRRVLRMITRNTSSTYFLWRGELVGFEYDLMREFARQEGLRLEVMVPPSLEELLPWLREGRGDVLAAALTPTMERMEGGVAFTRPYNFAEQVIVARKGEIGLDLPEDLAGRTVFARRSAAYWNTMERIRDDGVPLGLVAVPEELESEEIIERVALGEYDLTVVDSHEVEIELNWRDDVEIAFAVSEILPMAWGVRETNPELREALDAFIQREYRGLHYNLTYEKYFRDVRKIRARQQDRVELVGELSPYDGLVRKYSEMYGFDWRLIVSMMYQESRFNPRALSFAGASGLMQVLPLTASSFGFDDLHDPEESIHAGVKYLAWVRDRFEPELTVRDRMWFTLAAYNAGPGHVRDARRLARQMGLNPNIWFGNVERAMLLLSRPQYAQAAQHGYCRCGEPVRYVRDVRARYNAYAESIGS